jgi:hypothetical protein
MDVARAVVGQINALSVYDNGDFTFRLSSRRTARVLLGEEGIVDIEREVELSEETHSGGLIPRQIATHLMLAEEVVAGLSFYSPPGTCATLAIGQWFVPSNGDAGLPWRLDASAGRGDLAWTKHTQSIREQAHC